MMSSPISGGNADSSVGISGGNHDRSCGVGTHGSFVVVRQSIRIPRTPQNPRVAPDKWTYSTLGPVTSARATTTGRRADDLYPAGRWSAGRPNDSGLAMPLPVVCDGWVGVRSIGSGAGEAPTLTSRSHHCRLGGEGCSRSRPSGLVRTSDTD